jgi:hypothetical protein
VAKKKQSAPVATQAVGDLIDAHVREGLKQVAGAGPTSRRRRITRPARPSWSWIARARRPSLRSCWIGCSNGREKSP